MYLCLLINVNKTDEFYDKDSTQFKLIVKSNNQLSKNRNRIRTLKFDLKPISHTPKKLSIFLIDDDFEEDRIKTTIYEGKMKSTIRNEGFKDLLYVKIYDHLNDINIPIKYIDAGNHYFIIFTK